MHEEFDGLAALEAIGSATEEESRRLEEHCADCSPCADARAAYLDSAAAFALALDPVTPRRDARDTLLRQIETEAVADSIVAEVTESVDAAKERAIPAWWFAAAAVFFLALFGWSELRLRALRQELDLLQHEKSALTDQNVRLSAEMAKAGERMETVRSASQVFRLAASDTTRASASVFMDGAERRAVIIFDNLEKNDAEHSYQLWIIRSDKEPPMSAGVFDADEHGHAEMHVRDMPVDIPIAGLAVTLEPRGGLTSPSGAILLQGKA